MTFPFPIFSSASRVSAGDIFTAMAANAGSYASSHPSNYSGGMFTFSDTQTFDNSPEQPTRTDVFRNGDTSDSTFTAGSQADSLGLSTTTALAWQSSNTDDAAQDPKINGSAATAVNAFMYQTSSTSDNGKTYRSSYRVFKATAPLTASTTTASVDFQGGSSATQLNNKGGIILLPGSWEADSRSSVFGATGTLTIPGGMLALVLIQGNPNTYADLLNFGTNANLAFLLHYNTWWYDNVQVAVIGNLTGTDQDITYSLGADRIILPKAAFFKLAGD